MSAGNLLSLARATVNAVPTCLAITVDSNGDANARAINTSKLTDDWTVRFMTDRRTRKVGEIARTGRMTLVYHHQAGGAYQLEPLCSFRLGGAKGHAPLSQGRELTHDASSNASR